MSNAPYWIDKLDLAPHPEGGFYRQTYRADLMLPHTALPPQFEGDGSASTAIYFLLAGDDFSAFHRIPSDELWHFYAGHSLSIHVIDAKAQHDILKLGPDFDQGEHFQAIVPAGCWFASCLTNPDTFALVGCTVAPGFDFADFEMADRSDLIASYPKHRDIIQQLTRESIMSAPHL